MIRSKNREDERYLEGVDCRSTNALTCNKINTLELNERRTNFKRMSSKIVRGSCREDEWYLEGVDCRSNPLTCNKINKLEWNERRTNFKRMSIKNIGGACRTICCVFSLWNHFLKYLKLTDPLACIVNLAVLQALNQTGWVLSNLAENDSEHELEEEPKHPQASAHLAVAERKPDSRAEYRRWQTLSEMSVK